MQYVGGKQKSGGAQIAAVINRMIRVRELNTYSEPFCGGLSVTQRIAAPVRHASDACDALICMYKALQSGAWTPPQDLTREEWVRLRDANDPQNPLTAFANRADGVPFDPEGYGNWSPSINGSNTVVNFLNGLGLGAGDTSTGVRFMRPRRLSWGELDALHVDAIGRRIAELPGHDILNPE